MSPKNYYKILQVDPCAEQEVIEGAYKKLALKYHPDKNKSSEATRRMQEVNEAYAVLGNIDKRKEYDKEQLQHLEISQQQKKPAVIVRLLHKWRIWFVAISVIAFLFLVGNLIAKNSFILRVIHDLLTQAPHTLFVHFPIALTSAALFFILLAMVLKNDLLEQVAFANISLAAVSTVVTAIIGIRDNIVFYNGAAPNHVAKIILASVLFVVTTVTAIVRWRNPKLFHSRGKALYVAAYFVGFALVSVLGFLGGVIIYGF